jgi:hypothetical protein
MFNKILLAYDESPESGRALLTGIHLAKSLTPSSGQYQCRKIYLHTLGTSMQRFQEGLCCYVSRRPITTETF